MGWRSIGASLWTSTVKVAIARPRPPGPALAEFSGYSFPSGHTLNSTVTYGLIGLLVWRTRWPRWVRAIVVLCLRRSRGAHRLLSHRPRRARSRATSSADGWPGSLSWPRSPRSPPRMSPGGATRRTGEPNAEPW